MNFLSFQNNLKYLISQDSQGRVKYSNEKYFGKKKSQSWTEWRQKFSIFLIENSLYHPTFSDHENIFFWKVFFERLNNEALFLPNIKISI